MDREQGTRIRARHDSGRGPLRWRRTLLVLGAIGVTAGAGLAAAVLSRWRR